MDLTTEQAATRLKISVRLVQTLIQRGHFPNAFKLDPTRRNSPLRIPESDIKAFEQARHHESISAV